MVRRGGPPGRRVHAPVPGRRSVEEATLRIGDHDITLLGSIPGFVPDGAAVHAAMARLQPKLVALGVPPEDMAGLAFLAEADDPESLMLQAEPQTSTTTSLDDALLAGDITHPVAAQSEEAEPEDFAGLDASQERLLELLRAFGEVRLPSPDLEAAFAWAKDNGVPVEPLDMDDETHTSVYVDAHKFFDVIRAGRLNKRLATRSFEAPDAPSLVRAFDAYQTQLKSLRKVEEARERHMAERLRAIACDGLVAVVPLARMLGVRDALA